MPSIESNTVYHLPAVAPEPQTEEEITPVEVDLSTTETLDVAALPDEIKILSPSIYARMTIYELKRIASDRKLPRYSSMNRAAVSAALTTYDRRTPCVFLTTAAIVPRPH